MKGRNLIFWGWRFGILVHNNLLHLDVFWLLDTYISFYAIYASISWWKIVDCIRVLYSLLLPTMECKRQVGKETSHTNA
jgi:hypothetical protein